MTIFFGKSVRRWATLLVVLTVTAASLLQIADIKPAFASYSNTYPWGSAPCAASGSNLGKTSGTGYWCSGYNWGESPCPSGDGFCTTSWLMNGYYLLDQWGEGFRNCVSYTAWQLKQIFNVDITSSNPSGWGNGKDWNNSALAAHYSDDTSPQIGDIAQWDATQQNTFGHVAYVYNVVNGVASYAEYNYAQDGAYLDTYTSATQGAPTHYIHIGTVSPPHSDTIIKVQKTIEPDGTQQLYTATSSDVWQTWWNSNSGTTPLIYISQNNIADVVEFDAGGGVQDLFTATNTGVWETNWGNGQNPSSSNIIANLSNV